MTTEILIIVILALLAIVVSFCVGFCFGCNAQNSNDANDFGDISDPSDTFVLGIVEFYAKKVEIRDKEIAQLKKQLREKQQQEDKKNA